MARQHLLLALAVCLVFGCVAYASTDATNEDVHSTFYGEVSSISASVDEILNDSMDVEHASNSQDVGFLEAGSEELVEKRRRVASSKKARKATKGRKARKSRKSAKRSRKSARKGRKTSRKARKGRKTSRKARKASKKARKLRKKAKKAQKKRAKAKKFAKKAQKKGKAMKKKTKKLLKKQKKAKAKAAKKLAKAQEIAAAGKLAMLKANKTMAVFNKTAAHLKQTAQHANDFNHGVDTAEKGMDGMITHAVRLHANTADAIVKHNNLKKKHKHFKQVVKRFKDYQNHAEKRRKEMSMVKKYKGKLGVNTGKNKTRNFMRGGPLTKRSPNSHNALQRYQLKVLEDENKREVKPNVYRQKLASKLQRLYKKAHPTDASFLTALLTRMGKKTSKAEVGDRWAKAVGIYKETLRKKAEKAAMDKARKKAIKAKKAEETKKALLLIKNGPPKPEQGLPDDWLDKWPKKKDMSKENWWGCIDCKPETKAKKNMKKKKNPNSKPGDSGLKIKVGPIVIPHFDPSSHNVALVREFLKTYDVKMTEDNVKHQSKDVRKELKGKIVMNMLSEKEKQELLLAKTEELEKVIANKADFPVMVKHSIPHYKPPSKNPFPKYEDGNPREDPQTMDREVEIETANGYLDKTWRTARQALDGADGENLAARNDHEAFNKRYEVLKKDIVWKQFDGEGDAGQLRAHEVNEWRKKYPNKPLEDGNEPW